ncbi:unnamed protein product [Closterium sp. NIES-64]|nr:unnamed protein product [Closterium sp. NIES-64]
MWECVERMSAAGEPRRWRYNKLQDDFPSLREYNDYLEHVEDIATTYLEHVEDIGEGVNEGQERPIVFLLVEGIDVAATEEELGAYDARILFRLVEGIDAAAATEAEVRAYEATMLFRLVEGIDAAAAEAEVRAYEANNRDSIAAARAKRVSDSLQGWCRGVESGAAVWREGVRAYEANNRDSIAAARAKRVSDSMQGWCRGVESGAAVKRVVNGVTVWRVLQWYGERRAPSSRAESRQQHCHPDRQDPLLPLELTFESTQTFDSNFRLKSQQGDFENSQKRPHREDPLLPPAERRAAELRAATLPPKPGESSVYQLVELRAAALLPKPGKISMNQLVGVGMGSENGLCELGMLVWGVNGEDMGAIEQQERDQLEMATDFASAAAAAGARDMAAGGGFLPLSHLPPFSSPYFPLFSPSSSADRAAGEGPTRNDN